MSILIKGMGMPKNCRECKLIPACSMCEGYSDVCRFKPDDVDAYWNFELGDYPGERPEWCPLIAIPTPHGRLIDGDELFKQLNTACAMMSGTMKAIGAEDDEGMQMELKAYRDIRDGIKDCDTVIEAEGE